MLLFTTLLLINPFIAILAIKSHVAALGYDHIWSAFVVISAQNWRQEISQISARLDCVTFVNPF